MWYCYVLYGEYVLYICLFVCFCLCLLVCLCLITYIELYVDFEKEILPKHLRPQRFKWEPLGKQDIDSAEKDKEDGGKIDNAFETIDSFDPTQERRNRLKSF